MGALQLARGPLTEDELDAWYALPEDHPADTAWVRGSFIATLDGRATGPDGRSGGLNEGSEGDHAAFEAGRRWAEAVVVGAGTARAEGYPPLEGCLLVVVTRSGDVPASLRDHPDVLVVGGDGEDVGPERVLAAIRDRGLHRVVVEGGPALFGPWVAAGAVDELCVTVRPVLAGGEAPSLVPADVQLPQLVGEATHLIEWDGDLLLRTRLR
ncbi:hypothetical protein BJF80_07515 [Serinicoccus sp. CUA-874]|uniref:dihydrofolate reductase family protein n=1 Tax=Serinicoccus sp. CUA-874 TaxID=1517939 RepID=UPI000962E8EC|nr:dihydrofolate reductase family protein [Serinicoccus sp. CUA-874]OLT16390.1 hypothetical protein BJF80_07515 [Serinicoccus sp. CUA-874]